MNQKQVIDQARMDAETLQATVWEGLCDGALLAGLKGVSLAEWETLCDSVVKALKENNIGRR
jgi:uncharacterized cysteine cluster protein YcgN (CxxCxxCC family)